MNSHPDSADMAATQEGAGLGRASRLVGLYGPLLLALYFVATVRWGSYLLPGPPYIGDIALAALILHRAWTLWRHGVPKPLVSRWLGGATLLLLVLACGELLAGPRTIDAFRDAAPYFYAVLVLLGQSYREIPERVAESLVFGTLTLLMLFFAVADIFPEVASLVQAPGGDGIFLLQPRGDIDGAMIAVLAALALDHIIRGRALIPSSILLATSLVVILGNQSRSALFAFVGVLGLVLVRYLVLALADRRSKRERSTACSAHTSSAPDGFRVNILRGAAILITVPAIVYGIGGTPEALERSINVVKTPNESISSSQELDSGATGDRSEPTGDPADPADPSDQQSPRGPSYASNSGVGTFTARADAWRTLVDWLHAGSIYRAVFGVGFGVHYLQLSGADVLLLGPYADPGVRSAHSFVLNTWSRLGWVGLLLMLAISIAAAVAAVRLALRAWDVPILDLFAGMTVIAIPVTALVGVVLEAPFGAIPYFWAVGYLGARMVEIGRWRAFPMPPRLRWKAER